MENEEREDEESTCPYLTPKLSGRPATFSVPVYCRKPNGRVRVPSRDQLMALCTAGHHHDCPGYRRLKPRDW
jgi:hypothetical protein